MADPIFIARNSSGDVSLLPALANRHGLITGATGTGKTVTLQRLAEGFSQVGVPVFMADVKGDLSGIAAAGSWTPKIKERIELLQLGEPPWQACPVTLWDVWGEQGHPIRATVSDMGPLMLGRLLDLNDTQEGVLSLAFKVADDNGLLLLDLKDLRALLGFVGEHASELKTSYGNVSAASIGAIQRGLLQLEQEGAERFFGEPMLDIHDLLQTDQNGRGVVNLLAADTLLNSPRVYSSFLLWLLAELFENLPEAGDLEKPKLVFFFDEAHLLFKEAPKQLLEKIEQMVRLIRSKGVGVYFVTQSPLDIPDSVLGQLGNRVQHALRAFTPKDQKTLKAVVQGMRPHPGLDIQQALVELGVGEALISLLDQQGTPGITQRAYVAPPLSRIGPLAPSERAALRQASRVAGVYDAAVDRESAFEVLKQRVAEQAPAPAPHAAAPAPAPATAPAQGGVVSDLIFGSTGPRGGRRPGLLDAFVRTAGSSIAREITRGVFGSLLGSPTPTRRRRR